jgi:hypothetical protein
MNIKDFAFVREKQMTKREYNGICFIGEGNFKK